MGHKRHRIKGDFTNVNPGRGGPGITENGYPPHLVVSVEHPEINPKGVTIESFTEEVTEEEVFGTNVGEAIEDLINEETNQNDNPNNQEEKTMNTNTNEKTETINNNEQNNMNNKETETMNNTNTNQENNMNNANVKPDGTIDDGSQNTNNVNPQKPSLAKEAASAFVVGAAYGAGTVCAVIGISLLVSGIRKLACGDATATDAATADTTETVETVAEAFLR